jgi:hypothetical protein
MLIIYCSYKYMVLKPVCKVMLRKADMFLYIDNLVFFCPLSEFVRMNTMKMYHGLVA